MLSRDDVYPKMAGESEVEDTPQTSDGRGVRRCIPARALTRYIQPTNQSTRSSLDYPLTMAPASTLVV
jgi:hypothetical protein